MKIRDLALLLVVLAGCPKPESTPTPVPPPTATPEPTVTAPPPPTPPPAPVSGTRTKVAEKKVDDSWDKMLVAGGRLYVLTEVNKWSSGPMYVPAARLWSAPIGGGELTKIMDLEGLASLAADDASLYVAVSRDLSLMNTPRANAKTGRIFRIPLAGGAPVDLAKGIDPRVLAVDGDTLWFDGSRMGKDGAKPPQPSGITPPIFAIAFDDESVYFTSGKGKTDPPRPGKNGRVLRMPKAGGAPVVIASGLPDEPSGLALDGTHVYVAATAWGSTELSQAGVIARVPKAGGALEVLATAPEVRTAWVSGDFVYARAGRPGRPGAILKVAKTGGGAEPAIEDPTLCFATMDVTSIYFSSDGQYDRASGKRLSPAVVTRFVR
jgi:hypothetical protein